jgi:hypothetical protein
MPVADGAANVAPAALFVSVGAVPVPPFKLYVTEYVFTANTAFTDTAAFGIVNVAVAVVVLESVTPPPTTCHSTKCEPVFAVAVSVTSVPAVAECKLGLATPPPSCVTVIA